MTTAKTWLEIIRVEPALAVLAEEAIAYKKASAKKKIVCANARWYGSGEWRGRELKESLIYLVGDLCRRPELKTSRAYDIAYQHIYNLLPDCRGCGCMGIL